jgi:hypothetical protein
MPLLNLTGLFEAMDVPDVAASSSRFTARSIPGFTHHRIAKDHEGAPALLIAVKDTSKRTPPPIMLENLSVQHNTLCTITQENGTQETAQFSVVRCTGANAVLHRFFLRTLDGVITTLGSEPTQAEVTAAVRSLVELFRAMTAPARKTVQGFWAELLLLADATDPMSLLTAWHATTFDTYDFNRGSQRIEVKSAGGRVRQHHFSLAQLQPPVGTSLIVASMYVEPAGAGVSVGDLIEEIRVRLSSHPALLLRLDQMVIATLGQSWQRAFDDRFDRQLAESSLRFYDAAVIPAVSADLPTTVTEVHFKSNLTDLFHLKKQDLRAAGGLFSAVLPR